MTLPYCHFLENMKRYIAYYTVRSKETEQEDLVSQKEAVTEYVKKLGGKIESEFIEYRDKWDNLALLAAATTARGFKMKVVIDTLSRIRMSTEALTRLEKKDETGLEVTDIAHSEWLTIHMLMFASGYVRYSDDIVENNKIASSEKDVSSIYENDRDNPLSRDDWEEYMAQYARERNRLREEGYLNLRMQVSRIQK